MTDALPVDQQGSEEQSALVNKAAHSVKWAILYNIVPRLVTPISTLILGALLTPEDFGLVAISTFVVALARILIDPGLGKALIQRQADDIDEAASITFVVNILTSAVLYLGLWLAAPAIAFAYKHEEVIAVIRVAALALPFSALTSTPKSLLRRDMEFNRLFWIYSSFLILQAIASVILAALGWGAWAIIWGQIFGMVITVVLSWRLVKWRPKFVIKWSILQPMLIFSIWVMVWGFQEWAFSYADNAIAGLFLGIQGLGIYSLGFNIATLVPGFLIAGLSDVAYSTFCKMQKDPAEIGQRLVQLQTLAATFLLPVAFGMAAVAPTFISLLYGKKWPGLGEVIALLVIMPGLSSLWSLNAMAFQAIGKPKASSILSGVTLLILIPLLWIAAPYGLMTFTVVRFGVAWMLPLGYVLWGAKVLRTSIQQQGKVFVYPLLLSAIMFAVVYAMIHLMDPFTGFLGWIKFFSIILIGGLTYLLSLRIINPKLWGQMILGFKRMF